MGIENEKNILILSMSTLNYVTESYYASEDNSFLCRGISQLEAGTKYFLRKLQQGGKKLDRIFIIESKESTEKVDENIVESINKDPKILHDKERTKQVERKQIPDISAVKFYEDRIYQYIMGKEEQVEDKVPDKVPDEFKTKFKEIQDGVSKYEEGVKEKEKAGLLMPLNQLYENFDSIIVPVKEFYNGKDKDIAGISEGKEAHNEEGDSIDDAILTLVQDIRDQQGNHADVNLFLDMQGARRYETYIINTVMKMLDLNEKIKVQSIVATDFLSSRNLGQSKKDGNGEDIPPMYDHIIDTTINNRILDMVSGMNEFIKTGRGETLNKFWNDPVIQEELPLNDESHAIIDQIEKISDSISLCDVKTFENSLQEFPVILNEYKAGCNFLFDSFVDDLKNDYKGHHLFPENEHDIEGWEPEIIDLIEWCKSKKLYQQALTLLESKIPISIVDDKILYYGDQEKLNQLMEMLHGENSKEPDYIREKSDIWEAYKSEDDIKFGWIKYMFNYDPVLKKRGHKKVLNMINPPKGSALVIWGQIDNDVESKCTAISELLKKYNQLVQLRNAANHGRGADVLDAHTLLAEFIDKYIEIKTNKISLDYSKVVRFIKLTEEEQVYQQKEIKIFDYFLVELDNNRFQIRGRNDVEEFIYNECGNESEESREFMKIYDEALLIDKIDTDTVSWDMIKNEHKTLREMLNFVISRDCSFPYDEAQKCIKKISKGSLTLLRDMKGIDDNREITFRYFCQIFDKRVV